ncbi:class I SAM-dependent methyltransferase [Actinomycetospora soli]|uniref:class I SAM-dependent methyltransferase n=1 Tax=Actinomycetospora soli TaxID=2893887 RepID=UPI001E46815E|nr:methyltransferase domain-containing protein [Actinomycetospora soli]MCD2187745.1 class I SAM-dependent methyltransferase [Actinomycetospora soli]
MAEAGGGTYAAILTDLLDRGVIGRDDAILVQFAGEFDEDVTARVGLTNCTFSNLAPDSPSSRLRAANAGDAHAMPYADASFDHVIGHAGLHHCSRPHQALHEMYRIARQTVVAVENQDSPLMRLACSLGLAGVYEHDAVADGGGTTGGVDGSGVPNHVYRWTRHEVRKTVASFDPGRVVPIEFHSRWLIGSDRALTPGMRSAIGGRDRVIGLLNGGLNTLARRQGNIFGFTVRKDLAVAQPWVGVAA